MCGDAGVGVKVSVGRLWRWPFIVRYVKIRLQHQGSWTADSSLPEGLRWVCAFCSHLGSLIYGERDFGSGGYLRSRFSLSACLGCMTCDFVLLSLKNNSVSY